MSAPAARWRAAGRFYALRCARRVARRKSLAGVTLAPLTPLTPSECKEALPGKDRRFPFPRPITETVLVLHSENKKDKTLISHEAVWPESLF